MKRESLKTKTRSELFDQMAKLKKDLMLFRFQKSRGELQSTAQIRVARRQVARVLTQLNLLNNNFQKA